MREVWKLFIGTISGAKFPFVMKLCFSSSRQIGQGKGPQMKREQSQEPNQRQPQNNGMEEHEY